MRLAELESLTQNHETLAAQLQTTQSAQVESNAAKEELSRELELRLAEIQGLNATLKASEVGLFVQLFRMVKTHLINPFFFFQICQESMVAKTELQKVCDEVSKKEAEVEGVSGLILGESNFMTMISTIFAGTLLFS